MMITPEMMERLGGKRGKAKGPDMTKVVVEEGAAPVVIEAEGDGLEDALDGFEDGRKKKKKAKAKNNKKKGAGAEFDTLYTEFKKTNEKLTTMVSGIEAYTDGLRQMCAAHLSMALTFRNALGQLEGLGDTVREYHNTVNTCAVGGVATTLLGRMEQSLRALVIEPVSSHLKLRLELEARMQKKIKKKEEQALCGEMEMFADSMLPVMRGPFTVLKRCQIDFLGNMAELLAGGSIDSKGTNLGGTPQPRGATTNAADSRCERESHCPFLALPLPPTLS